MRCPECGDLVGKVKGSESVACEDIECGWVGDPLDTDDDDDVEDEDSDEDIEGSDEDDEEEDEDEDE